ncbi:MAG: hypothetical protein RH917_12070 [Lacipirellulaceae bacterium]
MSHMHQYDMDNIDYSGDRFERRKSAQGSKSKRPTHGRRRGKSPTSVNGIHRRRKKKLSW